MSDFEFLYPQKIKKNIKDIILSREWMKQNIAMKENVREISSWLAGQGAVK